MKFFLEKMKFNLFSFTVFKQRINQTILASSGIINTFLITSTILVFITIAKFISIYFPRTFLSPTVNGDETKYYGDLIKAINEGFINAIDSGASITFLSFSYFLNNIIADPVMSIRWISFVFGFLLIITFLIFGRKFLTSQLVYFQVSLALLYYLIIQLTLFVGYNDLVMHFFGLILWILFLKGDPQKQRNYFFAGILLALVLTTRKMGLIYILVFLMIFLPQSLYQNFKRKYLLRNLITLTSSFIFFLCLINISSLINGNGLSFDDKILKGPVNWAQWEYHNAILIDEGTQDRFQHVDMQKTKEYLTIHGPNSLPSSFIQMITFDIFFTFKEFFIDSIIASKYFLRQTGFWPFIFAFFFITRFRKIGKKNLSPTDILYLFSLSYFLIICFIVITNIQMRWFTFFVPIMFLVIAKDLEKISPIYQKIFLTLNNFCLAVMFLPSLL